MIFHMCREMIEMRLALQAYLEVVTSTKTIFVSRTDVKGRGSVYRALSAESSTKHGLGPNSFVCDELGEAPEKDELLDTMMDGQQAVASPLAVTISTQTSSPTHPLSIWIADAISTGVTDLRKPGDRPPEDMTSVFHIYLVPEGCDVMDQSAWIAANPTLKT